MRYGLLSDVHGNLAALRAAVAFLADAGVDAYLCAGDVVGYGPQPNECVEIVASLPGRCVAGNHDLMVAGRLGDRGAGALARRTLDWTRSHLDPAARAWIEALPLRAEVPGVLVAHGALDDPSRYVTPGAPAARELARLSRESPSTGVLVLGHTHRATAFGERSGQALDGVQGTVHLAAARSERWLLNPGAVGQSRARGIVAGVAVLDCERRTVAFHALPYDVDATRAELRRRGLPVMALHVPPPSRPIRLLRRIGAAPVAAARRLVRN
jgi:predicted phosphodiesterase